MRPGLVRLGRGEVGRRGGLSVHGDGRSYDVEFAVSASVSADLLQFDAIPATTSHTTSISSRLRKQAIRAHRPKTLAVWQLGVLTIVVARRRIRRSWITRQGVIIHGVGRDCLLNLRPRIGRESHAVSYRFSYKTSQSTSFWKAKQERGGYRWRGRISVSFCEEIGGGRESCEPEGLRSNRRGWHQVGRTKAYW